jgi:hypothetical protein
MKRCHESDRRKTTDLLDGTADAELNDLNRQRNLARTYVGALRNEAVLDRWKAGAQNQGNPIRGPGSFR